MSVVHVEPNSMALFYSMDADPKFGVELCNPGNLSKTVQKTMFCRDAEEDRAELENILAALQEDGKISFEDGWLVLTKGMQATAAFLMEKVTEAVAEQRYEDKQRFDELKRREAAEGKYARLQEALIEALGDRIAEIAAKAARPLAFR